MPEIDHDLLAAVRRISAPMIRCMYCGRTRQKNGCWLPVPPPLKEGEHEIFSHGICPRCYVHIVKPKLGHARGRKRRTAMVAALDSRGEPHHKRTGKD